MSIEAMAWALRQPISGNAKVMLLGIANHASSDGRDAYPALATLAEYGHCDRSTARRNVRKLIDAGFVRVDGFGPKNQMRFSLAMCGLFRASETPVFDAVEAVELPNSGDGKTDPEGLQNATPGVAAAPRGGGTAASEGVAPMPPEPSLEPSLTKQQQCVRAVFDAWVSATGRSPEKTKLTPERRNKIAAALKSHGLDDCLAAVRNIGASAWASGHNKYGRPFNDVRHALGDAEKIERYRDYKPDGKVVALAGTKPLTEREELRASDGAALMNLIRQASTGMDAA